jgi:hypothetical protein
MTAMPSSTARVFAALAYLQATSFVNAVRQRARRLRQPKYLFGALFAGAYVYFFFIRHFAHGGPFGASSAAAGMTGLMPSFAALGLLGAVLFAWLLPGDRAALRFSEAEVAFLFPAPLTRVALINFSLLRAQLAIFVSAFLLTLLFGRGRGLPGSAWQHATGLWLLMATLRLHFLGASFAHERLLGGLRPFVRYLIAAAAAVAILGIATWWVRTHVPMPPAPGVAGPQAVSAWLGAVFGAPVPTVVLAPFRWLATPLFAPDTQAWLRSLVPAFALMLLHYAWVVYSHVAFEEASMDRARRRAERRQELQAGKSPFRMAPAGPRTAAFLLAPRGFAPTAFLWKGLIDAGPVFRARWWLLAAALIVAANVWKGHWPQLASLLAVAAIVAVFVSFWVLLVGPMMSMRGLRESFEHLDVLKAAPLRGWQIALGQLLTPMAIVTGVYWLLLLLVASVLGSTYAAPLGGTAALWTAAVGIALLVAPLSMLMLCVPLGGMLFFPGMSMSMSSRNVGFEVAGQRMIFVVGLLLALALVLLPTFLFGGLAFLLVKWLANTRLAIAAATVVGLAVLGVELVFTIGFLGARVDRFDVSQELR